jgi:hypothetical protein
MGVTNNGALHYESGQQLQPFEALTDSGDKKKFEASFAPFSGRSGYEAAIRPYGLATGGTVIAAVSGSNDVVDVAALTAYMAGNAGADAAGLVTVAADTDVAVTRGTTKDYLINSVTIDNTGAVAVVAGTEGDVFSETRAAAGGPPLIPVGSVEIGQVRLSSQVAAAVAAAEIYQVPGTHQERYDFPVWQVNNATGEVTFAAALPAIHTGSVPKKVYAKGYTPIFAEISRARDFVPSETSHSVNSTDYYDGPLGSVQSSIGQGSFVVALTDGITDAIMGLKNENLWFKWFQDRNKAPYTLTQGVLGVSRTFPVGDHVQGNFTISAERASTDKAS